MRTMSRQWSRALAGALLLGLSACVTSIESEVKIPPEVPEDKAYYEAFKAATQRYQVITDFENRYELSATFLSQEFRNAFSERYKNLYNEREPLLEEAGDKLGFFVTLYTANRNDNDLTDDELWNIQLEQDGKLNKPIAVKHLGKKERWEPFFTDVSPWSKEYLLLFEIPSGGVPSNDLVKKSPISLIFSNANGKVAAKWGE